MEKLNTKNTVHCLGCKKIIDTKKPFIRLLLQNFGYEKKNLGKTKLNYCVDCGVQVKFVLLPHKTNN